MASSSSSSPEMSGAPPYPHTLDRYKYTTQDEVLEDLTSRFILNLPDEELTSLERICFQVEQAHWFYEDFIREENPKFPSLPLKRFSEMLFQACPLLHHWSGDHEGAFNHFMQYKTRVPVCGAIMLNDTWDKVVLVKGWKSSSGWGFPKGKINQNEAPHACAAREVMEETGYNLSGQIERDDVIEMSIREQLISLFIVPGVPEDYLFQTKTRKEISKIEWFRLADLPTWKKNKTVPGKFYLISPFIAPLKVFINERKPRMLARRTNRVKEIRFDEDIYVHKDHEVTDVEYHSHASRIIDPSVQESSSQSSSADNGDPQTPSPLYSERLVNDASVAPASQDITPDSMDPHFARLMNALSSSAMSLTDGLDNGKPPPSDRPPAISASIGNSMASSTPVPGSAPSTASGHLHAQNEQPRDWSMRGPRRSTEHLPAAASEVQMPPRSSSRVSKHTSRPSVTGMSEHRANSPARSTMSSPPASAALSSTSDGSMTASRSKTSHRSSSTTADISPYLTRPVELPSSGKRLKQLALLESVADESARMTPALGQRRIPSPAQGMQFAPYGNRMYPPHLPPPSTSVPPAAFGNLTSVYPNNGPYQHPHPLMHRPPVNGMNGAPQMLPIDDDPFTVRPRTSNAFRTIPHATHSRHLNMRGSMGQVQLLSALAGNQMHGPMRPMPPSLAQVSPMPPAAMMMVPPPLQYQQDPIRMGPAPPSLRVVPPHLMAGPAPVAGPLSAPALSPNFNAMRAPPHNNSNLLSILNSGGSGGIAPSGRA